MLKHIAPNNFYSWSSCIAACERPLTLRTSQQLIVWWSRIKRNEKIMLHVYKKWTKTKVFYVITHYCTRLSYSSFCCVIKFERALNSSDSTYLTASTSQLWSPWTCFQIPIGLWSSSEQMTTCFTLVDSSREKRWISPLGINILSQAHQPCQGSSVILACVWS